MKKAPVLSLLMTALLISSAFASTAFAMPAEVLIIRHAEKTSGTEHLSPKGEQRAQALIELFASSRAGGKFATPNVIFAASPHHDDGSIRSIQTVTPLAHTLHLTIHQELDTHEVKELVSTILNSPEYDGKVVLICWEHKRIPEIATELGVTENVDWDRLVFDRVWKLDFNQAGQVRFADLPQNLLPGDSN
jgi:hypothetical protein